MHNRIRTKRIPYAPWVALLAVAWAVAGAGAAVVIEQLGPAAPPGALGDEPLVAFPPDLVRGYDSSMFMDVDHAPGALGSALFGALHNHRRVGEGWDTWSHGYTGDVYYTNGALTSTIHPPLGTRAFVLYVGVESATPVPVTVMTDDGTASVQDVSTASGFGFHVTEGSRINSITVSAPVPFAVGEFMQSTPEPELHVTPIALEDCCWQFDLGQYAGKAGDITEVTVVVNTPGVSIISAGPSCAGGPAPTVTPTGVVWQIPTGFVATYPNYAATCSVQICFQAPPWQVISLTFTGSSATTVGQPPALTQTVGIEGPGCSEEPQYPTGCDYLYTVDADFDKGTLLSVNHDSPNNDQLQVNNPARPLPYFVVAGSTRGTIIRIDVNSGQVLGEYLSAPVDTPDYGRNPSRTTVDLYGNAWAGNRGENAPGSVIKIGICVGGVRGDRTGTPGNYVFTPNPNGLYVLNPTYSTCIDRDGDGLIKTSRGLGDILPWTNVTDGDGGGIAGPVALGGPALVQDAEDEAILIFQRVNGGVVRAIAVDGNNDVWVGGYPGAPHIFDKLDGNTGQILTTVTPNCGGYGALITCDGDLWAASISEGQLWQYDPNTFTQSCLAIPGSYGLGIDTSGYIWNTSVFTDSVYRIDPSIPAVAGGFPVSTGGFFPRGVANTPTDDHMWIANSSSNTVTRLDNSGVLQGTPIPVGSVPSGVSVDTNGKIWVTNVGGNSVVRIKPIPFGSGVVDLTVPLGSFSTPASVPPLTANPYTYSDGTGLVALNATAGQGTWDVIQDSGTASQVWGKITWNTEPQGSVPPGTSIIVEARAANTVAGLGTQTWLTVSNGVFFSLVGRYIEVRATLKSAAPDPEHPCDRIGPVLSDLRIECCGKDVLISRDRIRCKCPVGTGYDYQFLVQNLTSLPISQFFFTSLTPGVAISPAAVSFVPAIPPGGAQTVTLSLTGSGAVPGAEVCFSITQDQGGGHGGGDPAGDGCQLAHCITLPPCGCVQIVEQKVTCQGTNTYLLNFRLANIWGQPIAHVLLIDDPAAPPATFSPAYFAVSMPSCNSLSPWLQTTITAAPTPSPLLFKIVALTPDGECCTTPVEVVLPEVGELGRCCYNPCKPGRYKSTTTVCSEAECAALGGVFLPNPVTHCVGCWIIDWTEVIDILPLGLARLDGDDVPGSVLDVSELGLEGDDGVRVEFNPSSALRFDWGNPDPFDDLPPDAYLEVRGYGECDGAPDHLLGVLRGTVIDAGVRLDVDFTSVGTSNYRVQVFAGGMLVATADESGPPAAIAEAWPKMAEFGVAWTPTVTLHWPSPVVVTIPGQAGVAGDRLVLTALSPTSSCSTLGTLELVGAGVSAFTLYDLGALLPIMLGDANCDGLVTFDDIKPFVLALSSPAQWQQQYPNCPRLNGDANLDGSVTFDDIKPFVALIGRGG